ncbi:MAG: hypothetical protein ACD_46C00724G0006 [uncultured bacterium]|nr:MAG: hypothetical protein ACD_46C00724G0006 [uncultured bacterium]
MNQIPKWLQNISIPTDTPSWLIDYRQQAFDKFIAAGLPNNNQERYKYTDWSCLNKEFKANRKQENAELKELIRKYRETYQDHYIFIFVNGFYAEEYSDQATLPKEVVAESLLTAFKKHESIVKQYWPASPDVTKYPFANLNAAIFTDGLFLLLPEKCVLKKPIRILSLASDTQLFSAHLQNMIVLKKESEVSLVKEYCALTDKSYFINVTDHVYVEENAKLEVNKFQQEHVEAIHMAHTFLSQKNNSRVVYNHFARGGLFSRDDVIVNLEEPGAECLTGGFYRLCRDHQYADNHVDINHLAPHSHSEMLYKGILDKKSRAVFNGKLLVEKDAQKILAYQANHNILLSKNAEVFSKPALEIYADDVKCKHGATTGQMDEDALFYMRSRGIHRAEAANILLQGFAGEVIQRVTDSTIKSQATEMVQCHECGTTND